MLGNIKGNKLYKQKHTNKLIMKNNNYSYLIKKAMFNTDSKRKVYLLKVIVNNINVYSKNG